MVAHGNQPCPNIAQVTIEMEYDGQSIFQDYYFEKMGGYSTGDMSSFASAAVTEVSSEYPSLFTADVKFIRVVATDLTNLTKERHVQPFAAGLTGSVTGQSVAGNVAWSVQKQTGNRGKGAQGRIMWGPLPESNVGANTIDGTFAGLIVAEIVAVCDNIAAAVEGSFHVVLSRWENKVWREFGIGKPVLNIGFTNLTLDSMKLRLPQHKKRKITAPAP